MRLAMHSMNRRKGVRSENHSYRIVCINFRSAQGKIWFEVKQCHTGEMFKFSAQDIYYDDELLKRFSPSDIREIVYVAAWELFAQEREGLDR